MDPYKELNVEKDAGDDEIKRAHREALRNHPDRGGDNEAMARANAARDILLNPKAREQYDKTGTIEPEMTREEAIKAKAHAELFALMSRIVSDSLQQNDGKVDFDIVKVAEDTIAKSKMDQILHKGSLERDLEKTERLKTRCRGELIERIISARIEGLKASLDSTQMNTEVCSVMLDLLKGNEHDPETNDEFQDFWESYGGVQFKIKLE